MEKYMGIAIKEALKGVKKGHGGPFGAVIVKNSKVIAKAHNLVFKSNDPTAHAEVTAIRKASKKLKTFNLSGCVIYTTCEPCPMCLSAIIWAKIKKVYYGCTKEDAAKLGFDDKRIYDHIKGKIKILDMKQIEKEACIVPMKEWSIKSDKAQY